MNNNSLQNSAKRTFVLASVLCGVIFAFSSFIIKPLSIALSTDIMFTDSWIMYVLDALLVFCEVASYSIMFASIIYFVICLKNSPLKLIFLCLAICVIRRIADAVMTLIVYGALSLEDLYLVLFYLIIEFLQLLLVWFFASKCSYKHSKEHPEIKKAFDKENPLQVSALLAGVLLALIKVVSRGIYDVSYSLFLGGPQSFGEIIAMIIYYLSDIAIAIISYTVIILAVKLFAGSRQ